MTRYLKDPAARLDYAIDWTAWVPAGDTITASVWTAEPGVTLDAPSLVGAVATTWAAGGTAGQEYVLTNQITTAAGRVDERSLRLLIVDR